ncbi:DNA-binding protein [Paenibacillus sp. 8b26]|uniref:DNA-binding protein n=1 Tax=Paenibacillus sp. 8b26 TaxID=3424133 RepID=UPI003D64BB58
MENATTIRSEIEKELKLGGYTFNSFGQATGLNRGIFSAMLNGNPPKPISVRQMDLITKALNYPEDWLYDLYVDECFYDGRPHWKRVKPFLIRCVEIGNLRCVEKVLSRLMEDLNHIPTIFALAEELYEEGKYQEAAPFYECVIENEKYQHSERLAISHYRIFSLSINVNPDRDLEAALRFMPFRNRVPLEFHLDGLLKLTNLYYKLHQWKEVERYADELRSFANIVCENRRNNKKNNSLNTERHLVVYYGQSYLMKGNALEKQERYEEAMRYTDGYADLSWFEDLGEIGRKEVRKFTVWADANRLNLNILMGNTKSLPMYIQFLKNNPQEILLGLLTIVESANKHGFSIEHILQQFSKELTSFNNELSVDTSYYNQSFSYDAYADLCYQLAIYMFNNFLHEKAIYYVLKSLRKCIEMEKKEKFAVCTALFQKFRSQATKDQKLEYENIMEEVLINANKKNEVYTKYHGF